MERTNTLLTAIQETGVLIADSFRAFRVAQNHTRKQMFDYVKNFVSFRFFCDFVV